MIERRERDKYLKIAGGREKEREREKRERDVINKSIFNALN